MTSIPNSHPAGTAFVTADPEVRIVKTVMRVLITYPLLGFKQDDDGTHTPTVDESSDSENGKTHWDTLCPEESPETGEYLYEGEDGCDYWTTDISVSDGQGGSKPLADSAPLIRGPASPNGVPMPTADDLLQSLNGFVSSVSSTIELLTLVRANMIRTAASVPAGPTALQSDSVQAARWRLMCRRLGINPDCNYLQAVKAFRSAASPHPGDPTP